MMSYSSENQSYLQSCLRRLLCCCDNTLVQNVSLRVHKFTFQWDLFLHLFIGSLSILPFFFSGNRMHSIFPIVVWCVYNIIFLQVCDTHSLTHSPSHLRDPLPYSLTYPIQYNTTHSLTRNLTQEFHSRTHSLTHLQASRYNLNISPDTALRPDSYRRTFQESMEDFFSKKVLYIVSVTFLLVVLSLSVSGHQLGGPPICFSSCGTCLASWY